MAIEKINYGDNGKVAREKINNIMQEVEDNIPSIGQNGNWYLGETDTNVPARGEDGNGIESITSSKSGKITTVTIRETNGDSESFEISDGQDGSGGGGGSGDVVGPDSSVNGNVAIFDGTTGKAIKDSGKKIPTTANDVGALPSSTKYGASLSLSVNTTNFVVTAQLKDQNGNNLGNAGTIDLPLESVVVSGSYDDQAKKIILTLQNGSTVEFSVADLVSGLQTEINSNNKLDADLVDDTSSTNKFVSADEKSLWNGKQNALTAGSNIQINGDTISAIDTTYSPATSSVNGLVKLGSDTVQSDTANAVSSITGKTYALQLNSNGQLVVNVPWTDTVVNVDSAMSDSSTNPVQNKVISKALGDKQSKLTTGSNVDITPVIVKDNKGPCPFGRHVPTKTEWESLITLLSSISITSTGDICKYLHLPYFGYMPGTSYPDYVGTKGLFWCANASETGKSYAYGINDSDEGIESVYRGYGLPVRAFRDTPLSLYGTETYIGDQVYSYGSGGIFRNQDAGTITITDYMWGSNFITISDKNLGATSAWSVGDTPSYSNSGNYLQWGNNCLFGEYPSVAFSSVDASGYGPGNYYYGESFVWASVWDSSENENLWGGESLSQSTAQVISATDTTYSAGKGITIIEGAINSETYLAGEGIKIWDNYSPMQGPCPTGRHLPTSAEFQVMVNIATQYEAWIDNSSFKIPLDGYINTTGSYDSNDGYYTGNLIWGAEEVDGYSQALGSASMMGSLYTGGLLATNALHIRPFKDIAVIPDSSWTDITPSGSTLPAGAGIFRNSNDGLISFSENGAEWITMADKNLGATTVWASGDTLSEANCGKFYQWGNNYGFAYTGPVNTSSTLVDTTGYGPGNYYSSDTFITNYGTWGDPWNANLWGGVDGARKNEIVNTGVISVNGQGGAVTVNEFSPSNTGSTGQVLKKTSNGYQWANESGGGGGGDGSYLAGTGINIDANNEISNTLPFDPDSAGSTGQVLKKTADGYDWANESGGSGDVVGPSSSTNGNIPLFDGATGKLLKDSGVGISSLNVKCFTITGTSGATALEEAQAVYDWRKDGNTPIVIFDVQDTSVRGTYLLGGGTSSSNFILYRETISKTDYTNYGYSRCEQTGMVFTIVSDEVTSMFTTLAVGPSIVSPGVDYTTPYTPEYNGSPATKKYVDDHSDFAIVTATSGATLSITNLTTSFTPSVDFTVSAGTVKEGMQYVLRIESGATAYTMTLGTGITNPFGETLTLTANKTTTVVFFATSSSTLELFTIRTAS